MIPTTTHASAQATPHQLKLLHLPDELIGHIAVRIRGVDSLLNFARTCRRFAGVSTAPLFKLALTDNFVTESEMKIASCEGAEARAARIYDLVGKIGSKLQPRHLNALCGLLRAQNQAERDRDIEIRCRLLTPEQHQMLSQLREAFTLDQNAKPWLHPLFVSRNRAALVFAALLSGQINSLDADLKAQAKKSMSTVWKNPRDALSALFRIFEWPTNALERKLVGHAAVGIWIYLQESSPADASDLLRGDAVSLLIWCAPQPIDTKIGLLEKIVEWSAARPVPRPRELEEDYEPDDEFTGPSREMVALLNYHGYVVTLNNSAVFSEPPDPALAPRFFTILDLAVTDMLRYGRRPGGVKGLSLDFAKMLPALPWRENGEACLRWLENVIRHHEGVVTYSSKPPSDSQEPFNDEDTSEEPPSFFGYAHNTPFPLAAWKALIPPGIFTDKELAYLVKGIADGTFSWEALEHVDPPASTGKNSAASH